MSSFQNNKIHLKPIMLLLIVLLLLIVPQINISGYVQSTITSKFIWFQYGCLALLGLFSINIILHKTKYLSFSKVDLALGVLLVYVTLNRYVIQTNFSFSIRYMELIELSCLYLVLRHVSIENSLWLLLAIVVSGTIQAIHGNLQLLNYYPSNHSGFKMTGSFFNPGPYAGFLSAVWPIALGMYLFKETLIKETQEKINSLFLKKALQYIFNYIPLLGVVYILLVIPASQSRASWLSVLVSSSLLLEWRYQFIKKLFNKLNDIKKAILIAGSILVIGISLFGVYHFKQGSSDGRLFIWKVSTDIIKGNPVFGVGFDRFKAHYMNHQANYFSRHGETDDALVADNTYYAFNEFLQFIVENGIFGFIIFISVLYFIIKTSIKKEKNEVGIVLKISVLSIGVFAFFSYPMEILPVKLIIVVLVASLATMNQKRIKLPQNFKISFPIKLGIRTLATGCVLMITVFSVKYVNRLNASFKNWGLALQSYQYGDYERAIEKYEKAYPELKNNGEFLMNYGKALSIYRQDEKAIQILEQAKKHLNTTIIEMALGDAYKNTKQYKKAEIVYNHAATMIPTRFYPLYLLVKLYEENNEKEKAVAMATIILNKEVKIPSTAIKEIRQEVKHIITKNKMFN